MGIWSDFVGGVSGFFGGGRAAAAPAQTAQPQPPIDPNLNHTPVDPIEVTPPEPVVQEPDPAPRMDVARTFGGNVLNGIRGIGGEGSIGYGMGKNNIPGLVLTGAAVGFGAKLLFERSKAVNPNGGRFEALKRGLAFVGGVGVTMAGAYIGVNALRGISDRGREAWNNAEQQADNRVMAPAEAVANANAQAQRARAGAGAGRA